MMILFVHCFSLMFGSAEQPCLRQAGLLRAFKINTFIL